MAVIRDERDRADLAGLASGPTRIARKRKPCKRSFPNRLRHCLIRTPDVALAVLQLPSSTGFVVDRGNRMPVGLNVVDGVAAMGGDTGWARVY